MFDCLAIKATLRAICLATGLSLAAPAVLAEPLKLVTGNDYLPFADNELPDGGMATVIVRAVYDQMDTAVDIDFLPWKRGYLRTRLGAYAATFPYARTQARAADFHYSAPIFEVMQRPVKMADSAFTADTPADLPGATYCLPNGYAPARIVARMTDNGELARRKPTSMTRCFAMLDLGRVDFIPMSVRLAEYTAEQQFGDAGAVAVTDLVLETTSLHVIFPKRQGRSRERLTRFNEALEKLRKNGAYRAILERYHARSPEPSG
jgi:polar amino acid transport system substrate-binding protein